MDEVPKQSANKDGQKWTTSRPVETKMDKVRTKLDEVALKSDKIGTTLQNRTM